MPVTEDVQIDGRWAYSYTEANIKYYTRAGVLWKNVNTRCRPDGPYQRKNPTYTGVTNEFDSYQYFVPWCKAELGYTEKDKQGRFWSLDKDIILPGNKSYSPRFCCFVPAELNVILIAHTKARGAYPLGVHKHYNGNFMAQASFSGKQTYLGVYDTPAEAHRAWQEAKIEALRKAVTEFSYLQKKTLQGIKRHIKMITADYRCKVETIR